MVILVVFIILTVMTVGAIGLSQNSLRDLAITGNEGTGRKASEVADSAVDWVITWSNPNAGNQIVASTDALGNNTSTVVGSTQSGAAGIVQARMNSLLAAIGDSALRTAGDDPQPNSPASGDYGLLSNQTGSLRFFLRSLDYTSATAPELFQTGYTTSGTTFLQPSQVQQAFDTEVRYLGESLASRSSGTRAKSSGGLFLVKTIGRANIQGTSQSFVAQREVLVDYTP